MIDQELQQILHRYGEFIVEKLRTAIKEKPVTRFGAVNASGDLAASVRYEVNARGLKVFAADYIYNVEYGRAPGKFPPREAILSWIENKRLSFDIPINSLAFLIGRKIAQKGTVAFQQGGTDLVADVITPTLLEEIRQEFAEGLIKEIRSEILAAYLLAA